MILECLVLICVNDLYTIWNRHGINGHHEKDLHFIKHKENKMPRAKKTTTAKKRAPRKTQRRKTQDRRRSNPGDIFWTKVVKGFEKLLESPFK